MHLNSGRKHSGRNEDFLTLPTKHQFATIDEDQVFSTLRAAQVRSAGNLGDRPLIVLTATRQEDVPPEIPPKDAQAEENLWVHQLQPELARLSTHGKQIIVDSGHEMPTEHPEVVISAIHEIWQAAHLASCLAITGLSIPNPCLPAQRAQVKRNTSTSLRRK